MEFKINANPRLAYNPALDNWALVVKYSCKEDLYSKLTLSISL